MQWLTDLPFADNRVLQIGFLAACGIAALVVLALVYRLVFAHRLRVPGGRTRQPRLGLVDAFSLDGQRQLVLIRRDNVEHLVMIGGPNDVLIEPQINRVAPARENSQPSPLLGTSAPGRRTEAAIVAAPLVAEAPSTKVAAPAAASAPAAAPAPTVPRGPAAGPAIAAGPAAGPVEAEQGRLASAPPAAPLAAQSAESARPTPVSSPRPSAQSAEPARLTPVSSPPPASQSGEPARPAPVGSPPPRPAPQRPAMPPPIAPASGSANRTTVTRLAEKSPPKASPASSNPPTPSPAAPLAAPPPGKVDSAVPAAKPEPRATPSAATVPSASTVLAPLQPVARTQPSAPASDGAQQIGDARPPAQKASAALSVKPAPKVDDPFADLESLEAEMARLLGREKPN